VPVEVEVVKEIEVLKEVVKEVVLLKEVVQIVEGARAGQLEFEFASLRAADSERVGALESDVARLCVQLQAQTELIQKQLQLQVQSELSQQPPPQMLTQTELLQQEPPLSQVQNELLQLKLPRGVEVDIRTHTHIKSQNPQATVSAGGIVSAEAFPARACPSAAVR